MIAFTEAQLAEVEQERKEREKRLKREGARNATFAGLLKKDEGDDKWLDPERTLGQQNVKADYALLLKKKFA